VSLYGLPLDVTTIAFQEQDSETAACATTALWYALHAMPKKITTDEIPSPFEITKTGSSTYIKRSQEDVARQFPTQGMGLEQIEGYLRSHDLECIVCGLKPDVANSRIREYLDSYLRAGFPMIVVGNLYTESEKEGIYRAEGLHAMTALGYADSNAFVSNSASSRIQRLFAHDDNIGPFTSFRFERVNTNVLIDEPVSATTTVEHIKRVLESGSQAGDISSRDVLANKSGIAGLNALQRVLVPVYLVIPINRKVRVPLEIVLNFANSINDMFDQLKPSIYGQNTSQPEVSFSCRLKEVSTVKDEIRSRKFLVGYHEQAKFLISPMPKYVWDISFSEKDDSNRPSVLVQILVDATDLLQGGSIVWVLWNVNRPNAVTLISCIARMGKDWIERNARMLDPSILPLVRSLYEKTRQPLTGGCV
jgi:hypothetical protein